MQPCPPLPLCMCVCSPELSHRERVRGGIRRFRLVRLVQNGENGVSCRCHSCARILHRIVSQSQSDVDRCTGPPCTAAAANPYLSAEQRILAAEWAFLREGFHDPSLPTDSITSFLPAWCIAVLGQMASPFLSSFLRGFGRRKGTLVASMPWPEKNSGAKTGDSVAREAGPADLPEPPLVASPHCRDARFWPRCHLVAVAA